VAGIIGGTGSGKSAVTRGLGSRFRIRTIDADQIGHEVLTLPRVKDEIRTTFGQDVFDGSDVDRRALSRRVFGTSPHHSQSLIQLERIVHPEIRGQLKLQIEQTGTDFDLVVLDAAVMLEAGWNDLCDAVVFVDVPFETRLARVSERRGWDEDELQRREASQLSLSEKQQAAHVTITNDGHLDDAVAELTTWLEARIP
jgi:dephospho-CoA kinase